MALNDSGLLVRYYFDEAASGTTPTTVEDSSGNNLDLTLNYGAGSSDLEWTEVSGNRGLESKDTAGNQRAVYAINNTADALRTNLDNSTAITLEVVCRLDSFATGGGRIFGINDRGGGNGAFMLRGTSATNWQFSLNTNIDGFPNIYRTWNGGSGTRDVWHVVFDPTQADEVDRIRVYKNGVVVTTTETISVGSAGDTSFNLPADHDLIAFNRESGGSFGRAADGVLFYAAIYDEAFDDTRAAAHYDVLTLDDDTPTAGGTVTTKDMPDALSMVDEQLHHTMRSRDMGDALSAVDDAQWFVTYSYLNHVLVVSELLAITDGQQAFARRSRELDDSTLPTDMQAAFTHRFRDMPDGVSVSDGFVHSVTASVIYALVMSDAVTVGDAALAYAIRNRWHSEFVQLDDSGVTREFVIESDDVLSMSDDSFRHLIVRRLGEDQLGVFDEVARRALYSRLVDDTLTVIDTFSKAITSPDGQVYIQVIDDQIEVSDDVLRAMSLRRVSDDTIEVLDEHLRGALWQRVLDDNLEAFSSLVASVVAENIVTRTVDDQIEVSDDPLRLVFSVRVLDDVVDLTDSTVSVFVPFLRTTVRLELGVAPPTFRLGVEQ